MKTYIGTKTVLARPMTRQAYNDFRGWQLPEDENGADEGMLVEYTDGGKANVPGHAGYVSWSPLDVFNRAYKPMPGEGMPPHQQRVLLERDELRERLTKLRAFMATPTFEALPSAEADRLWRQAGYMELYACVLDERIEAFGQQHHPV